MILGVKKTTAGAQGAREKVKNIELNILLKEKITAGLKECNASYVPLSKNKPKYSNK